MCGAEAEIPSFLILALDRGEQSASQSGLLSLREGLALSILPEVSRVPEPVWKSWRRKILSPLPVIDARFLGSPACSLVTVPSEMSWFL